MANNSSSRMGLIQYQLRRAQIDKNYKKLLKGYKDKEERSRKYGK